MTSIRVLQAIGGARHGGAEAFFTRLAIALGRAGLEQHIVIRRDADRAATLRAGGIEPIELPFGGRLDFETGRALREEIRAFAPDIVLTWMSRATQKCSTGRFVHAARLGGYYNLKYYRHCHHLIGNTVDIVDYIRRSGWPAERAHYLPNFVDAAPGVPLPRASLATPDGAPLVLALGRLHRDKAFDVLLTALAALPDVHCWLAGDGPERLSLEGQAKQLGLDSRLRFLGWRNDTASLYATADLLVCPSRTEPLGNVVIEAWARGVPVVAAASEGPGALIKDRENGLLVPIEDAGALASAIRRVFDDRRLREDLKENGRASYARDFTEKAVVKRYIEFFEQIAN